LKEPTDGELRIFRGNSIGWVNSGSVSIINNVTYTHSRLSPGSDLKSVEVKRATLLSVNSL